MNVLSGVLSDCFVKFFLFFGHFSVSFARAVSFSHVLLSTEVRSDIAVLFVIINASPGPSLTIN